MEEQLAAVQAELYATQAPRFLFPLTRSLAHSFKSAHRVRNTRLRESVYREQSKCP